METVFKDSRPEILRIIRMNKEEVSQEFAPLQRRYRLNKKEEFFLSRLSYTTNKADWLNAGLGNDEQSIDIVVTRAGYEGRRFQIRRPNFAFA